MSKNLNVKELCEGLWELEKDLELLEKEIHGIRFWEIIRFAVFSGLSEKVVGYSKAHTSKDSLKDKLIAVSGLIKNSIFNNPYYGEYTVDFLVYDHPRKVNVEGNNIDIYTHYFLKSYDNRTFDVLEYPYLWKHNTINVEKNRKYLDDEILSTFIKKS